MSKYSNSKICIFISTQSYNCIIQKNDEGKRKREKTETKLNFTQALFSGNN